MRRLVLPIGVAVASFCCATWFFFLINAPVALDPPVAVEVAPGETVHEIAAALEQAGVVRSARLLVLLSRIHHVDREIRHGTHEFAGAMTPVDVLRELERRPPQATIAVTIPEGLTWREIGALLEQNGIVSAADYEQAVCKDELRERVGASPDANCIEGYLFPDTYHIVPGSKAEDIVDLQISRFQEVSEEIVARIGEATDNVILAAVVPADLAEPWTADREIRHAVVREGVILASIIEKETSIDEERPLVSSVFHNRLRRGMRLQADPTVLYGFLANGVEWDRKHLPRYLRTPGPYNTYTTEGLPPGPICNPGRASLYAALDPTPTEYLYFVANGDGAHKFSATLAEHNRAVAQLRGQ